MDENLDQNLSVENIVPSIKEEPLVPQSKVNELVGDSKLKGRQQGYEQAKRELESKFQAQQISPEQIKQAVDEEFRTREQQMRYAQEQQLREKMAQELNSKLANAMKTIDNFSEKSSGVDFGKFANALAVTAQVDSDMWGHVMIELANNPEKLDRLDSLAAKDPMAAKKALEKLTSSIKQNVEAAAKPLPNEPLSNLKASSVPSGTKLETAADYANYFKGKY